MASETDSELEVIRAQTRQTRANLAEKITALESQVSQTVSGVTSAVEAVQETVSGVTDAVSSVQETVTDTVSSVSETVSGTVESVKETVTSTVAALDPTPHIQSHPWTAVGCAFAAGLAGGYLLGGSRSCSMIPGMTDTTALPPGTSTGSPTYSNGHTHQPSSAGTSQGSGGVSSMLGGALGGSLGPVGETLSELGGSARSLGISALMGLVSNLAKQTVPEAMQNDVCTALDKLKTRLGGHHNVNPETLLKS